MEKTNQIKSVLCASIIQHENYQEHTQNIKKIDMQKQQMIIPQYITVLYQCYGRMIFTKTVSFSVENKNKQ